MTEPRHHDVAQEPSARPLVFALTAIDEVGAKTEDLASSGGMAVSIGSRPGRDTTRALLERIVAGERGAQLRATVAGWNRDASTEQIEEAFQEACLRAERLCCGQTEGEVYVWLRTTTHREVGAMRDRARREIPVDASSLAFESTVRSSASAVDVLIEQEDRAEVDRLTLALLERLAQTRPSSAPVRTVILSARAWRRISAR